MNPPNLGAYARSLAQPIARGLLSLCAAQAGLRATAYRRAREGTLGWNDDPESAFRFLNWLLGRELRAVQARRAVTEMRIGRAIKPLLETGRKSNAIRAEAHDVNGSDGFPLTEEEVEQYVAEQIWWALPRGGRRHG